MGISASCGAIVFGVGWGGYDSPPVLFGPSRGLWDLCWCEVVLLDEKDGVGGFDGLNQFLDDPPACSIAGVDDGG